MRLLPAAVLAALLAALPAVAADAPTFETHVRPILKANCYECHGEGDALKAGLDLRLARTIARGGKSGPAVVAGKAEASLLLKRVRAGEMPPGKKKLTPAEIDTIARWVAAGAKPERPEPEALTAGFHLT